MVLLASNVLEKGVLINGYLPGVLVSLIIILPIFGIQEIGGTCKMDDQPQLYRNANALSLGIPCPYDANRAWKHTKMLNTSLLTILSLALWIGTCASLSHCLCLYPRYGSKISYAGESNCLAILFLQTSDPTILIGLGVILPSLQKNKRNKSNKLTIS